MAWVGDALFSLGMALAGELRRQLPGEPGDACSATCASSGPSAMLAPPRIWENMLTAMQVRAATPRRLKRRVFEYFRGARRARELLRTDGKPLPLGERAGLAIGEVLVYGPVRDQLGLRQRAGATPAARRSGPTPSASSAPSAST